MDNQILFKVIIIAPEIQVDIGTFSSYKRALVAACNSERVKDYLHDGDCLVSIRSVKLDKVSDYINYKETLFQSFTELYNTLPYVMST